MLYYTYYCHSHRKLCVLIRKIDHEICWHPEIGLPLSVYVCRRQLIVLTEKLSSFFKNEISKYGNVNSEYAVNF